jgi:mono/diheme cytochrome c family protein
MPRSLIVTYLFSKSTRRRWVGPETGNAAHGKELVESVGCLGCHLNSETFTDKSGATRLAHRDDYPIERNFGYNLANVGSKTYPGWIYNWVKDPKHYSPATYMPNLRLSDQQVADVATYLSGLKGATGDAAKATPDQKAFDDVILDYYKSTMPSEDAKAAIAKSESYIATAALDREVRVVTPTTTSKASKRLKPIGTGADDRRVEDAAPVRFRIRASVQARGREGRARPAHGAVVDL